MTLALPLNSALSLSVTIDEVGPLVSESGQAHLGLFISARSSDELDLLAALNIGDETLTLTDEAPP